MSEMALVLYQPPPTRELQGRLALLGRVQAEADALEREYEAAREQIRAFEKRWKPAVGRRYVEVEELKEKTERARRLLRLARAGRLQPSPEDDALSPETPQAVFRPENELRTLFRELARRVHPDRGEDAEDRQRRHEFMAEASRAYRNRDHRRLQWLLEHWLASPRLAPGRDIDSRIARANQKIAWARYRVQEMNHLIAELHGSSLAELRRECEQAVRQGRNLVAEMRARVLLDLERAQAELESVLGEVDALPEEVRRASTATGIRLIVHAIPLESFLAGCAGAGLLFAASLYHPVGWRLDLLRLKASGRLSVVSTPDLLWRMMSSDSERNGSGWILGTVTVRHTDGAAPCPAVFDTPLGSFHALLEDEYDVQWFVDKNLGLNLKQTRNGLMPRIDPGDVVIELGGWVGVFARAALLRGAAKVVVVEPVPDNLECLRRSLDDEIAAGRVEIVEAAAWSRSGTVRMKREGPNNYTGGSEGWNVSGAGTLEVRAVTVDELVSELGLERVDLLEMDIEGAERHALAGARETIRRFAPEIAVCIHHLPDDPEAVFAVMDEIRPEYQRRADDRHALYFD